MSNFYSIFFFLTFILNFIFVNPNVNAQINIDSLINVAENMPNDTNKVKTYLGIFRKSIRKDIDLAILCSKKAEILSNKLNYPVGEINSLLAQTMGLTFKGKFDDAKLVIEKAIRLTNQNHFEDMNAKANMYYGNVLLETNEYNNAVSTFLKAVEYYKKTKNRKAVSGIYNNIGGVYLGLKKDNKALTYYKKAMNNIDTTSKNYHITIYNIATSKKNIGKYDEALSDFFKSLKIEKKNKDSINIAKTFNGIALTYKAQKKYNKAILFFNKSLDIKEKIGNPKLIASTLNNLSSIYNITKEYKKAIKYASKSYKLATSANVKNETFYSLENLYFAYEKDNDYKNALKYYKLYYQVTDSLFYANNNAKELVSDYEIEIRDDKIKLQTAENKNKTYFIIVLALSLIIAGILSLFYIKNQKNKHKQKLIEEKNKETEKQKARFAKELHDGTGSNLTGIRLQLLSLKERKGDNGELSEIIKELDRTHQSIRLLAYQASPPEFNNMTLDDAIHDLVRRLTKTGSININYSSVVNIDWHKTSKKIQLEIYRIIQEALSNVIKHSEANNVDIQIIQHEHSFNLIIDDNGKGFDLNSFEKGLGIQNITDRTKTINGKLNIESSPQNGTSFIIDFPIPKI